MLFLFFKIVFALLQPSKLSHEATKPLAIETLVAAST